MSPRGCHHGLLLLLLVTFSLLGALGVGEARPLLRLPSSTRRLGGDDDGDSLYCQSWRLSVEVNNAGKWYNIPTRCLAYISSYFTGDPYVSDLEVVASDELRFAESVSVSGDGKDAWIFDVDETLLSNLPYYAAHGFGSEPYDEKAFDEWVDQAKAPAVPTSLSLYKELQKLGFKIIILTGRSEPSRKATEDNLRLVGFDGWDRLILRGASDEGKSATVYKSERRKELEDEGFRIRGNSGDQWTDLLGFAVAQRSFKLPNPMYYVP